MSWKKAKIRLNEVLRANDNAHTTALSWAVGISISFSPFLGLHTALAFLLAFLFRLNKVDVLLGSLVINPWTLPAYWLAATTLGGIILGQPSHFLTFGPHLVPSNWFPVAAALHPRGWLWQATIKWFVGASLLAGVAGIGTYFGLRWLMDSYYQQNSSRPPEKT